MMTGEGDAIGRETMWNSLVAQAANDALYCLERTKAAERNTRSIALVAAALFAAWVWYFYLHFEHRSSLKSICSVVREVVPSASHEPSWDEAHRLCRRY